MATSAGRERGERSPPPQQVSAPQPVAWAGLSGIRGDGRGHVTLSHRSSSALQTCKPKLPALTESSICQEDQTTAPTQRRDDGRVFRLLHVAKAPRSCKSYPPNSESLPPDNTHWPDGLIMYSRWVWIWNIPAGLTPPCWATARAQSRSRSLWPAPEGELIEALGWICWVSGGEDRALLWLAGHWHFQKRKEKKTGSSRGKLKVRHLIFIYWRCLLHSLHPDSVLSLITSSTHT